MHKKNNFDFLRLLFALFVLISHSYPLSGVKECDWLCQVTNGQVLFSSIGVKGFFVISGYLIFQSMERSSSLGHYYRNRLLRLFPALLVVLLLSVALGPFVYNGAIPYLHNRQVFTYVPANLALYVQQPNIAGIFDSNPYKSAINGSLWTIPYEFTMYVLLSALFLFREKKSLVKLTLLSALVASGVFNLFFSDRLDKVFCNINIDTLSNLGLYFLYGAVLAVYGINKVRPGRLTGIMFISLAALAVATALGHFMPVVYFAFPLVVITLGLRPVAGINSIATKIGDLSYGIYIYGFPVQQTLEYYFHLAHVPLFVYSVIISAGLAFLSWHWVEAKALQYKKKGVVSNA